MRQERNETDVGERSEALWLGCQSTSPHFNEILEVCAQDLGLGGHDIDHVRPCPAKKHSFVRGVARALQRVEQVDQEALDQRIKFGPLLDVLGKTDSAPGVDDGLVRPIEANQGVKCRIKLVHARFDDGRPDRVVLDVKFLLFACALLFFFALILVSANGQFEERHNILHSAKVQFAERLNLESTEGLHVHYRARLLHFLLFFVVACIITFFLLLGPIRAVVIFVVAEREELFPL
mmetsp:Transcript_19436/g.55526  ORF Transcript_19436/g.55526 Transcript_19436/m.55526 type:complete len:235 (+) Transcript_19436:1253-1957(+)